MISVLVCTPTVPDRQSYLVNCARSYERSTPDDVELNFSVVTDALSAGEGWQRCLSQGLAWWPRTDFVHFGNDDTCVASGWLEPLVESAAQGDLPAMRLEPAGGHVDVKIYETHPPMPPEYDDSVPRDKMAYFFASENQPTVDRQPIDHGALPFGTVEQATAIGFPPIHFGADRWWSERGRQFGWTTVARMDSVAFNYNALVGRHRGEWTETVCADFDGIFGLPAYLSGLLPRDEVHPLRETPEGITLARQWRAAHESGIACADQRLMTDEGRLELLREVLAR